MERPQRPQQPQRPQRPPMQNGQNQMQNGQIQMQKGQGNQTIPMNKKVTEADILEQERQRKIARGKFIKKLVIGILVAAVACVGIYYIATGRISSKVVNLESEVESLKSTIETNSQNWSAEKSKLEQAIADTTVKEVVPITSLQRVEGSQVPELWLIEGDFIAPNLLEIPGTSLGVNDSYVQIGQKFVFKPSDRWVLTSQGATFEFGHPQKIWGKIMALSAKDAMPEAQMQDLIQKFFTGYPATEITYRKIFIDDRVVGKIGKAPITVKYTVTEDEEIEVPVQQEVDIPTEIEEEYEEEVPVTEKVTNADGTTSEVPVMETITNADGTTSEVQKVEKVKKTRKVPSTEKKTVTVMQKQTQKKDTPVEKQMIVNVGFAQKGDYAINFLFVYDADGGSNSQELVDLLLRSGTYGPQGSSLKLE